MGRKTKNKHAAEMHKAVISDDVARLHRLVEDGADLYPPDIINRTLLHSAAAKGSINTAMALLDLGLDIDARNKTGETALFTALRQGKTDMAIALLERGARTDIPNEHGALPFGDNDSSEQTRETARKVIEKISLSRSERLHHMAARQRKRKHRRSPAEMRP